MISKGKGVPHVDGEYGSLFLIAKSRPAPASAAPAPSTIAAKTAASIPRVSAPQAQLPSNKGPMGQHATGSPSWQNRRVRGSGQGQACKEGRAETQREQAEGVRSLTRNHHFACAKSPAAGERTGPCANGEDQ
jgi:hypothetical protein